MVDKVAIVGNVNELMQRAIERGVKGVTYDEKTNRVFIDVADFDKLLAPFTQPDVSSIPEPPSPLSRYEMIARVAHEINRAYCNALGDASQPVWEDAPEWQRNSAINGVKFHYDNPDATPESSHESWLAQKVAEGWVYGERKDPEAKTHPCMLPYRELPRDQRVKDYLFKAVVDSLR